MADVSSYYFFRYFIHPVCQLRLNLEKGGYIDTKELVAQFFTRLEHERRIGYAMGDTMFWLYLIRLLAEGMFLCKFARTRNIKRHLPKEVDIEQVVESDYPFIYVVIDRNRQIIMLQKNTSVFYDIDQAKRQFHKFFARAAGVKQHEIVIDEIVHESQFWVCIEESEAIYSVTLHLKAPNLFGFSEEASSFLRYVKDDVNDTSMDIRFDNANGHLRINRNPHKAINIESLVAYASGGGGTYPICAVQ